MGARRDSQDLPVRPRRFLGGGRSEDESGDSLRGVRRRARQYVPALGRFLERDPIEGGSCNDYEYACGDPVGNEDLYGGLCSRRDSYNKVAATYRALLPNGRSRTATLRCGDADAGLRHIRARGHIAHTGWGERVFLDTIGDVLFHPTKITLQQNNRYKYEAPIETYYQSRGVWFKEMWWMTVITTKRKGYIITAYGKYRGSQECPSLPPC